MATSYFPWSLVYQLSWLLLYNINVLFILIRKDQLEKTGMESRRVTILGPIPIPVLTTPAYSAFT